MHACICVCVWAYTRVYICVNEHTSMYACTVCAFIPAVNNNWVIVTLLLPLDNLTNKINHASTCARRTMFWPPGVLILDDYM